VWRTELTRGIEQRRTNEIDGHHSDELLLLGALGFDSAGLAAAGFESADLESDFADVAFDDFPSGDFPSPAFDSPDDFESLEEPASPPLLPLSEAPAEAPAPSPFDADFRDAFWSFFPSLP